MKAIRNISSLDIVIVEWFNLLKLALGGHLDKSAFEKLDLIYGAFKKNTYNLPRPKMMYI